MGTVLVLHTDVPDAAPEDDLDVLLQAQAVVDSLGRMGHLASCLSFSPDDGFVSLLGEMQPDLVFNLVESVYGSGRWSYLAPELLDKLGYRYTGCPTSAVLVTADKLATKRILQKAHIPTPPWFSLEALCGFLPGERYIVKARYEDASIGLDEGSVVTLSTTKVAEEVLRRKGTDWGTEFFAERYIPGREFSISILGNGGQPQILAPREVCFRGYDEAGKTKILDYGAKWDKGSFGYENTFSFPCDRAEDRCLLEHMEAIARCCWSAFGLEGYARIDFRVDGEGRPWVVDVNANPCITPNESGFLASAEDSGMGFAEVVERLVREALVRDGRLLTPYHKGAT